MKVIKIKDEKKAVKEAVAALKNGGLVIYPTETCYGLGADATNIKAVKKVLEFKGSRGGKPVSIAVSNKEMAKKYVEINETAENLYQKFLPGPLTVVSKSRGKAVDFLQAGKGTLGVRISDYPLVGKIINGLGKPITSTSANSSGRKTSYCLSDVLKYTVKKRLALVDLFLDAGKLPYNPPSTVVDTTLNEPRILRQGKISLPKIRGKFFISNSAEETKKIAGEVLSRFKNDLTVKPLVFALQGELGAGKTQFAKGLARALEIKANVVSPTFAIIREYPLSLNLQRPGLCKFYHLDTWRLEDGKELLNLGLAEMLKPGNVVAIEWLQKIRAILEKIGKQKKVKLIWVEIETISETKREIKIR